VFLPVILVHFIPSYNWLQSLTGKKFEYNSGGGLSLSLLDLTVFSDVGSAIVYPKDTPTYVTSVHLLAGFGAFFF
jgi:hypothetical protein